MTSDLFNGLFEFIGGCVIWMHIARLRKDKQVRGMSIWPCLFFASWGWWNLYYYPSLGQYLSAAAGVMVAVANTYWLFLLFKYRNN